MAELLVLALIIIAFATPRLVRFARRRPERAALLVATVVVSLGLIATGVEVVDGIRDNRIEWKGNIDVAELRRRLGPLHPGLRYGQIISGRATMDNPQPTSAAIGLWALAKVLPWLLAVILLALLAPILRAAERGDPFSERAVRRLAVSGAIVLIGIPLIKAIEFFADQAGSEGTFAGLLPGPSLTISLTDVLPGLIMLVLAGVFRRGSELRDFEAHVI